MDRIRGLLPRGFQGVEGQPVSASCQVLTENVRNSVRALSSEYPDTTTPDDFQFLQKHMPGSSSTSDL